MKLDLIAGGASGVASSRATASSNRVDLYRLVHKGLRACICDALDRVGRLDTNDDGAITELIAELDGLLELYRGHLEKENAVIHPAMEARRPGSANATAADHLAQGDAFNRLETLGNALASAPITARAAAAQALYLELALFAADNFHHMHEEETHNNAVLQDAFTDAELLELQRRIVGSISPALMARFMRWMLPAMSPTECTSLMSGIRDSAPTAVLESTLSMLGEHLEPTRFNRLCLDLGREAPPLPRAEGRDQP